MHTVASSMSKSHGCTCGSQRCRNNLKFRNTKHSAKYIEKCIALDATDTVAQPGQVQAENQLRHTANCRTAYPILNRMPPLAHSSQHSPPKWALVGGCRCCKLAHTLTCTPWPVACHPHPPVGDHTPTVHAHLQAQKLQHKTKALSIGCVQRAANVRRPTP